MTLNPLYTQSTQVILRYQAASGAYPASPTFSQYDGYSWLRDGSFIAHAMGRAGEYESARAYFRWVDRALRRHAPKAERLLAGLARGLLPAGDSYLHTRYTLDGEEEVGGDWGNFQLDGYGTWLWALTEHVRLAGDQALVAEAAQSVELTVRYLAALWRSPNYDCWEEHPQYLHPYTLAAIYGGLRAAASLPVDAAGQAAAAAEEVRGFVLERGVAGGRLVKSVDPATGRPVLPEVDASLLGAVVPYGLLAPGDPIAQATLAEIERTLHRPGGGVYRYRADTYYGGGEWLLLAAWLGWYYTEVGDAVRARDLLAWVEAQADGDGCLAEQASTHLLAPGRYAEWEARWGPVARPLLWSHAMYLILCDALFRMSAS